MSYIPFTVKERPGNGKFYCAAKLRAVLVNFLFSENYTIFTDKTKNELKHVDPTNIAVKTKLFAKPVIRGLGGFD